jgi:glutaredoxin
MADVALTLLTKPGCHLCDAAREIVHAVVTSASDDPTLPEIVFEEKSILDDQALLDEFVEEIPVVLLNGRVHTIWRVDPVRLTTALKELV